MQRKSARRLLEAAGILVSLLIQADAGAHHSFNVHFVPEERVILDGVVTDFRFRNPHGQVEFDVTGDDGTVVQWRAETNSPNILRRRGWTERSIVPGDTVRVEGYPARDGSNFMRIYRVRFADGRELIGQRPTAGETAAED
jgi:hypothetical protein